MGRRLLALPGLAIAATVAALLCLSGADPASAQQRYDGVDPTVLEGFQIQDEVLIDGIAAQVGGEIVLLSDVRRLSAPIEEQMRAAGRDDAEILAMRADALERLIETKLMEEVVRRTQLSATDAEVAAAIAAIAEENGLSLEQLTESVQSHGLTSEQYRTKIKAEIERNKILNTFVRSRVRIEPSELRALYAERYSDQPTGGSELHLRHLLVAHGVPSMRTEATACAMVEDARQRIASGEAGFAEIAAQLSDANRHTGGDMGWILARDMAPWMAPAVESLEAGGLSETIATGFGCNLLQVVERREFQPVSFEQASPQLEQELFRQKMEQEYFAWMETLRDEIYVERKGIYAETNRLRDKVAADPNRNP